MIRKITSAFFFNPSRIHLHRFVYEASIAVPKGSYVLDAGAGDSVYKDLFKDMHYESADFCQVDKPYAPDLTYVCDLSRIPVEDNRYDLVLLSQVMEHLPSPIDVLNELHRVLKQNGQLWLSAPFYYEEHEQPYDFFRYTQYGFKELLNRSGFEIQKTEWLEGYYGTLAYQFKTMATSLPMSPAKYGGIYYKITGPLIALLLKTGAMFLSLYYGKADIKKKYTESGHNKNYCVIAIPKTSKE